MSFISENVAADFSKNYDDFFDYFSRPIYYNNAKDADAVNSDLKLIFARGDVTLKVKQTVRDYIANGKTIKVEFDGKTWNIITEDIVKKYLNNTYYVYGLEQTK